MISRKVVRWISKNPYDVLGVAKGASKIEVKAAYYRLVKLHHPDVTQGSGAKFKEIKEAYTTLSSESNSTQFDATNDKPFDAGDAYSFRQQTRQNYTYKKQQEEQEQEKNEKREDSRPVYETWRTEIMVFSVVICFLLIRVLLAEDEHQQHMNHPYELSLSVYQKELELDQKEFEAYVRNKGFEKVLRGK